MAVALAARMAILVVCDTGFMPTALAISFGFDNRKIAAKLPTPRREGTGKIKQEVAVATAGTAQDHAKTS